MLLLNVVKAPWTLRSFFSLMVSYPKVQKDFTAAINLNNVVTFTYSQISFVLFGIKTAWSCHLSVLHMNQTEKLAMKRVFGVIMLLITDYLVFLQV